MARKQNNNELGETRIRRASLDYFTIYEVTEDELNALENGTNSDLFLQFAIFCLSIFFSFLLSLLTGDFSHIVFTVFVCISIISLIIGLLLTFLWYRNRKSKKSVIKTIKDRLKDNQKSENGTTTDLSNSYNNK